MASVGVRNLGKHSGDFLRLCLALGMICPGWHGPSAQAKEPSISAIELYDGAGGATYVQLADVLINGKVELRGCTGSAATSIDKSEYGKLPKVVLAPGGVLERGADGVLRYRAGSGPANCVVPDNVKFEHNAPFTLVMLADYADLRGRPIGGGSDAAATVQPLKRGVKLVMVAGPDVELAEYLLAERVGTIAAWKGYLAKYPATAHADAVRRDLASMYVDIGQRALSSYQKTAAGASPAFGDLKTARAQLLLAHAVVANTEGEVALAGGIRSSLEGLTAKGQAEVEAYNTALAAGSPGYGHLVNARALADAVGGIDPGFLSLTKLEGEVVAAMNGLDAAVKSAELAETAKRSDQALKEIKPYRAFASEEPRVARVIDGAYAAYFEQAQQLDATKDWKNAVDAYQNALKAKETAEARDGLKEAQKQYSAAEDATAASDALQKSKTFELQHDLIPAYETLTSLSETQRSIVKDDIARLEPDYVAAASQRAKDIAKAYPTIQGIGDEKAVEDAYRYLQRASDLSESDADKQGYEVRMQNLGDELSAWFLDRAKHDIDKPLGSGTELGWAYLKEAESYKAANLEQVRDQMKLAELAHGMHSKLSIRVQFRDQTSQRQSEGFASQMESAIAAGLDTPGMQVTVTRSGDTTHQDVSPDFLIAGDVLEHNISAPPTVESIDSKYVAGVHEIPSEAWSKLNRLYDSENDELHTAQAALQGAESKGNKKAIQDATRAVTAAQKRVDDTRAELDATAKSRTEDIIRPYNYTKTTYNVINRIVLQFRIDDSLSGQKGEPLQIPKEEHKQFVVLSEVMPNDLDHVKAQGTTPDKAELQNELENGAREDLIKKVQQQVVELPHKIYADAQKRESDGYADDAGEAYMRYLNVATPDQMEEREHAEKFLREQFNFKRFPGEMQEHKPVPALEQGMAGPNPH